MTEKFRGINPILSGSIETRAHERPDTMIQKSDVVAQPTEVATKNLQDRGVIVERVETIDKSRGFQNVVTAATAPANVPPGNAGDAVRGGRRRTLLRDLPPGRFRGDHVAATNRRRDATVIDPAGGGADRGTGAGDRADPGANHARGSGFAGAVKPDRESANLARGRPTDLVSRDQQITTLQETVSGLRAEMANAPARVAVLESELAQMKEFRNNVNAFMTRNRPE